MSMLIRIRKFLMRVSSVLGGLFIILITLVILAQIIGRLVGVQVTGGEDIVAYAMAGAVFMALGDTFYEKSHIRLTAFRSISDRPVVTLGFELVTHLLAMASLTYLLYAAYDFVTTSYRLNDVSSGLLAMPMWIPQLSFFCGVALFLAAVFFSFVDLLLGPQSEPQINSTTVSEVKGQDDGR